MLQIVVNCWFLKQKYLKQHCRSLGFFLCVFYQVLVKNNDNEISCLKMLTFIVLNERNVVQSGPCPPSELWCCLS